MKEQVRRFLYWLQCLVRGHRFSVECFPSDVLRIEGRLVVARKPWTVYCRCWRVETTASIELTDSGEYRVKVGDSRPLARKRI
jgi:hypothetical protein